MRGMLGRIWAAFWAQRSELKKPGHASSEQGSEMDGEQGGVDQMVTGGSGNLQVGVAYGDVVSNVCHHTHHTHHVTVIQNLVEQSDRAKMPSSSEQSAVLRRLDRLHDRVRILNFMDRHFGTRMVIHLNSEQMYRLNRYLDVVLRDPKNAKRSPRKIENTWARGDGN